MIVTLTFSNQILYTQNTNNTKKSNNSFRLTGSINLDLKVCFSIKFDSHCVNLGGLI